MTVESHVFLLRFWNEANHGDAPVWRGVVRNARSGSHRAFQNLSSVPDIIETLLTTTARRNHEKP